MGVVLGSAPGDVDSAVRAAWASLAWWMGPNLLLALTPAGGAWALHRWRHRCGRLRWVALGAVGLMLPNAPYVITDLIHLRPAVETAGSRTEVLVAILPMFAGLLAGGVLSYAYCLHVLRRELADRGWSWRRRAAAEAAVDGLCAVGIVLGRIPRLNSWDVLRPDLLVRGAGALLGDPRALVLALAVVFVSSVGVDGARAGVRAVLGPGGRRRPGPAG